MKTQIGCMTEDPDTAVVLCDNVKGLGLALDPSHYIAGPRQGRDFSKVMPYVFHVHLRDTTKSQLHVRVGQGEVDYGRLITPAAKGRLRPGPLDPHAADRRPRPPGRNAENAAAAR